LHVIFNWVRISQAGRSFYIRLIGQEQFYYSQCNPSKKTMSISFFIIGGIIFLIYMCPNVLEYFYSVKTKGRKYPNLNDKIVKDKKDLFNIGYQIIK
jgi:hypothetical protein